MPLYCDLCDTGTYLGTDGTNRYCPNCESLRPIEDCKKGGGYPL